MVGGRRVHVFACNPTHRRTWLHIEPDWIEPDPGTERVAAHLDQFGLRCGKDPRPEQRCDPQAGERKPAGLEELTTRTTRHFASWAAR